MVVYCLGWCGLLGGLGFVCFGSLIFAFDDGVYVFVLCCLG